MLIAIMYHRVGQGKHTNSLKVFQEHLPFLKEHYPIVLPGDELKKLSVCLTFDDATYDFYHYIFPLLVKHQIRVVLAVPVKYIFPETSISAAERLSIHYSEAMHKPEYAPFCTWRELKEMVDSGLVQVASHSFSHANLLETKELDLELKTSKEILEKELKQSITTFIYPYGRCNSFIQQKVSEHYQYSFRIGSALNFNWDHKPLSRIRGDQLKSPLFPTKRHLLKPFFKSLVN